MDKVTLIKIGWSACNPGGVLSRSGPRIVRVYHRTNITEAEAKQLYESIHNGLHDGLLSIAGAKPIRFLTVDSVDEYQVFICPEPMSRQKNRYNTFAVNRTQGQIIVMGRELPYRLAMDIAIGKSFVRRERKTAIERYDCVHSPA